jgi:hypothetical protein
MNETMTRRELSTEERTIMALYRSAIENNLKRDVLQQLIFWQNKVYAVSAYTAIEVSNLPADFKPKGAFYDLKHGVWTDVSTFPINEEKIQGALNIKADSYVMTNKNLFLQYVNNFDEVIKSKSRFILAPGIIAENELVLSFDIDEQNKRYAEMEGISFMVADNSVIHNKDIIPGQPYKCEIVSEIPGAGYLLNVITSFGKVELALHHSEHAFVLPEEVDSPIKVAEALNHMASYEPQQHKYTALFKMEGEDISPTCFDARIFVDLIKAFSLTEAKGVRIGINKDPNKPVTLESMGTENDIRIRMTIATLNPFVGAQRR